MNPDGRIAVVVGEIRELCRTQSKKHVHGVFDW